MSMFSTSNCFFISVAGLVWPQQFGLGSSTSRGDRVVLAPPSSRSASRKSTACLEEARDPIIHCVYTVNC
ncbi:LOW QUALITY PROTEIN: putative heterogeneous nuclear ribonucleoprotein [Schistosoma mansoni]|uniref:putative heterogeneous nuclear ribonucleoprotein n=1 Tax=Schistosoma mansoni TaxID=6183 RepID=UPI00022DC447|nr:LOW QUALITY PROTEIN: putative heterogeneous nuclear ribonucleoprotein [Schistosoma mansoni]|eukprot:XP_018652521.1 LOW QUALITY PROTEIN: putative heterogeneous nuclear ribonucleoprotein [Schistosoma mansoni]